VAAAHAAGRVSDVWLDARATLAGVIVVAGAWVPTGEGRGVAGLRP
jgi:hypothetical protein